MHLDLALANQSAEEEVTTSSRSKTQGPGPDQSLGRFHHSLRGLGPIYTNQGTERKDGSNSSGIVENRRELPLALRVHSILAQPSIVKTPNEYCPWLTESLAM